MSEFRQISLASIQFWMYPPDMQTGLFSHKHIGLLGHTQASYDQYWITSDIYLGAYICLSSGCKNIFAHGIQEPIKM